MAQKQYVPALVETLIRLGICSGAESKEVSKQITDSWLTPIEMRDYLVGLTHRPVGGDPFAPCYFPWQRAFFGRMVGGEEFSGGKRDAFSYNWFTENRQTVFCNPPFSGPTIVECFDHIDTCFGETPEPNQRVGILMYTRKTPSDRLRASWHRDPRRKTNLITFSLLRLDFDRPWPNCPFEEISSIEQLPSMQVVRKKASAMPFQVQLTLRRSQKSPFPEGIPTDHFLSGKRRNGSDYEWCAEFDQSAIAWIK